MAQMAQIMAMGKPGYGGRYPTIPPPVVPASSSLNPTALAVGPATASGKANARKKGSMQTASASEADRPGSFSMLLCNVVVGRSAPGTVSYRRPPDGFDSVWGPGAHGTKNYAVFDNAQAYPAYLVHFNM